MQFSTPKPEIFEILLFQWHSTDESKNRDGQQLDVNFTIPKTKDIRKAVV